MRFNLFNPQETNCYPYSTHNVNHLISSVSKQN